MPPKPTLATVSKKIDELRTLFDVHLSIEKERANKVEEHDRLLIRGNGKASMAEELRAVQSFQRSQVFWLKVLGTAFIGQFIVVFSGLVIVLLQAMPILTKLISRTP